jgi:hypothetical protein
VTIDRSNDARWDIHTERQIGASKGGAVAVTVLNSGSWLALLSQLGNVPETNVGGVVLAWGLGALLGTAIWLFIYRGTALQGDHDFDRDNVKLSKSLELNIRMGVGVAIASVVCFGAGVIMLASALM